MTDLIRRIKEGWAPFTIAVILTIFYVWVTAYTMTHVVPKESETIVLSLIHTLRDAWLMSILYFFGSTAGSARKTELLANASPSDQAAMEKR